MNVSHLSNSEFAGTNGEHVAACLKFISTQNGVTLLELKQLLIERGVPASGTYALHLEGRPNTILWVGLSNGVYRILREVAKDPGVKILITSPLRYGSLIEGMSISLGFPVSDFIDPTWVPVVLWLKDRRS